MSKIVILTGSSHNPGTSKKLADAFEKGAIEAGNEVYRYDAGLSDPNYLKLDNSRPGMEVAIPDNDIVEKEVIPELLDVRISIL